MTYYITKHGILSESSINRLAYRFEIAPVNVKRWLSGELAIPHSLQYRFFNEAASYIHDDQKEIEGSVCPF